MGISATHTLTVMKGFALLTLLGLAAGEQVAVSASAEALERIDSIPTDKCGASIGTNEDDRLHIFALSHDSALWHKYQKDGSGKTWSSWIPLGGKQKFSSGASVMRNADGRLEVFVRGADKTIYHTAQKKANADESWTSWTCFGGQFASAPVAILNSQGYIEVYARGRDNALYYKGQTANSSAVVWSNWHSLGAELTGPPSVGVDSEGMVHIFVRGNDRALWHKRQIATEKSGIGWAKWENLGGVLASAPRAPASRNGVNLLEVFVRAADKGLWHRGQVATHNGGVAWGNWAPLGGILSSGPSVTFNVDNTLIVISRATDKAVFQDLD